MSVKIDVSLLSNQYNRGQQIIEVNDSTVGQFLGDLIKQFPSIKLGLFDGNGKLHSYIDIYFNGESASEYPATVAQLRKGVVLLLKDGCFGCLDLGKDCIPRPEAVKGKGFALVEACP